MKQVFRLKSSLLVVAIAAAYPLAGHGAAGVTQFTSGDVSVRRGAATDALTKGKNVESGDSIVTGPNGRAQVRFSDGGLVAVAPNSQFNITRYADANDGKQDAFLVDLLRGGMRAVTGLIGKRNRDNYKVTTQTATIGIRGSAFELAYGPDGQLFVSTQMDEIEVCTRAGCVGLTAGESATVISNDALAVRTNTRTSIVTPEPRQTPQVASNQVNDNGQASIVRQEGNAAPPPPPETQPPAPPPAPKGPKVLSGMTFSYVGGQADEYLNGLQTEQAMVAEGSTTYFNSHTYDGALVTDVDGRPEQFQATPSNNNFKRDGAVTVVKETGTYEAGDLMVLGTWEKAVATFNDDGTFTENYTPFAFVTGQPTSAASLAQMTGLRGEYKLTAGTEVFAGDGTRGTLLGTSKLGVNFTGAASADVSVYLDISLPSTGNPFSLQGTMGANDGRFSGSLDCSGSSAFCEDYLYGYASGFFGGEGAKKAGVTYEARSYYNGLGGAAMFELDGTPRSLVEFQTPLTAYVAYDGSDSYGSTLSASGSYGVFVSGNGGLVQLRNYSQEVLGTNMLPREAGSPTGITASDSSFIGWGYWTRGSEYNQSDELRNAHYVVGKPQQPAFNMGTASYTVIGSTTPTGSNGQTGSLQSATFSVNFQTSQATASATALFGATQVSVSQSNMNIYGGKFGGYDSSGAINGILTGANGQFAGFVYSKNTGGALGTVNGAVGFQRSGCSGCTTATPQ
ncbi:MAG: FecR family protein [Burkholderiaceae bacterium]